MQSCKVTAYLNELWAPVSPSLCSQSPELGRAGPPQPVSAATAGLGMPPAAFKGLGRPVLDSSEGDEETPQGGIFKENTLEQHLLDSCIRWPHSAPQPPCKSKSCQTSQSSNLGGIFGWDLCPGETCSGHPPLVCTDCYHPLVSTFVLTLRSRPHGFCW